MNQINTLDIEASGFGTSSYPIEIAISLADGRTYSKLIRPVWEWKHWDKSAESIHRITLEQLTKYGADVREVCHEINEFCGGLVLYSDAWSHDSRWLMTLFAAARMPMQFQCRAVEMLVDEESMLFWGELKAETAKNLGLVPHRALNDALIIQGVLENILYADNADLLDFQHRAKRLFLQGKKIVSGWA